MAPLLSLIWEAQEEEKSPLSSPYRHTITDWDNALSGIPEQTSPWLSSKDLAAEPQWSIPGERTCSANLEQHCWSQQSDSRYTVVSQRSKAAIFDGNGKGTFSFQAWISPEMCQLCQCSVIASSEVVLLLLGAIFNSLALVVIWGQDLMPLVTWALYQQQMLFYQQQWLLGSM